MFIRLSVKLGKLMIFGGVNMKYQGQEEPFIHILH